MKDLESLKKLFSENKIHIVDVREQDEWDAGHIEGAYFLPLSKLPHIETLHTIPKDLPVYLYCSSGRRAVIAKTLLQPFIDHVDVAGSGSFEELKSHGFSTK